MYTYHDMCRSTLQVETSSLDELRVANIEGKMASDSGWGPTVAFPLLRTVPQSMLMSARGPVIVAFLSITAVELLLSSCRWLYIRVRELNLGAGMRLWWKYTYKGVRNRQNIARQEFEDIKLTWACSRCERAHQRVKQAWKPSKCIQQVRGCTRYWRRHKNSCKRVRKR